MQIKKIIFDTDEIFENKTIDFCNEKGVPYMNIILAGENGSGKTYILDRIDGALKFSFANTSYMNPRNGTTSRMINRVNSNNAMLEFLIDDSDMKMVSGYMMNSSYNPVNPGNSDKNKYLYKTSILNSHEIFPKILGRIQYIQGINSLSKTSPNQENLNTATTKITSELTTRVSKGLNEKINDFADINEWNDEIAERLKKIVSYGKKYIERFSSAYQKMMGIKITVRNKMPTFIKNGKPISIKDFSSGESEIIFRSFDLLKNENIDGNIVLIDEPEVHLHPSLQQKIYKFYKRILSNNEQQTNQLFIATHSEYLLKSAINDPNTLVLTLKWDSDKNKIVYKKFPYTNILPYNTFSELKYSLFEIYTNDFHNELYGFIWDYVLNTPELSVKNKMEDVDNFISKVSKKEYEWYESEDKHYQVSLPTYIRNLIHHPEKKFINTLLKDNFDDKLKESTDILVSIVKDIRKDTNVK